MNGPAVLAEQQGDRYRITFGDLGYRPRVGNAAWCN
jgi:hypothetical protein